MFSYQFKVLFKISLFSSLFAVALACTPRDSRKGRGNISQILTEDEDGGRGDRRDNHFRGSCSQRNSYSDEVSINHLKFVDSRNAGQYLLEGRCEEEDKAVFITVNGYDISHNPKCDRRRWEVTLDLSSMAHQKDKIVFQIKHNNETLCKEAQVTFTGPKNYIPVPPSDDHYESSFYVMKYEARIDGKSSSAKAISTPKDKPVSRVSYQEALDLCQNNGNRYDLIQNVMWQNIVLSIENTAENWSEGRLALSDNNNLNCGVSRGFAQPASLNDLDDCATRSCQSDWDENRRTHILENGERIWDICGNVGEMMKDKYTGKESFTGSIYELSSQLKKLFGPKRTYRLVNSHRRDKKWNLGSVEIQSENDLIIRGAQGSFTGIFSVEITRDQVSHRGSIHNVGFRCVYIP